MIETTGRVISSGNGTALVEPQTQSSCGSCRSRSSCGVSGLGQYFSGNRKAIEVQCGSGIRKGDELQLSMSEGDLIRAGLLVYLLPSVLAIIGAGIAASSGSGDGGAVLGAGAGFAAGFMLARLSGWTPHLVAQRNDDNFSKGEIP